MNDEQRANLAKRQLMIGRVAKMHDAGKSTNEIATALKLSESTVRSCVADIERAREYRAKS